MADNWSETASDNEVNNDTFQFTKQRKAKGDKDWLNWVEALAHYVRETSINTLDLGGRFLSVKKIQSVLVILPGSQVTELILDHTPLENCMEDLLPLLIQTKISKLSVSDCEVTNADLLQLAEVLKVSQITNLNLSSSWGSNYELDAYEGVDFLSFVRKSKLTILKVNFCYCFSQIPTLCFFSKFLDTSITCLDLQGSQQNLEDLTHLFENLGDSSVTDLSLRNVSRLIKSPEALQELSRSLAETKIEKLNLSHNRLNENGLEILARGLVNSKVIDLNLEKNKFLSLQSLSSRLKGTKITTLNVSSNNRLRSGNFEGVRYSALVSLNISNCKLTDEAGAELIESLKFSCVKKLDIRRNPIGILTVKKLSENVKNISLTDLDVSQTPLSPSAFNILGSCLKDSKLTRIGVSRLNCVKEAAHLLDFLKLTKGSSISQVEMYNNYVGAWSIPLNCGTDTLVGTNITELHLGHCQIWNVSNLVNVLKNSAITYLYLQGNRVCDDGARVLADCLKDTEIRRLDLSDNIICSPGAKALAFSLKGPNLLYCHLDRNSIRDDGVEFLAQHAQDTYVSELSVTGNHGKGVLLVETVLWCNKISVHKLASIFKLIAPQPNDDKFCFGRSSDDSDVNAFVGRCLWFYETVMDKPQAISVLLEEKVVSSRREMMKLVADFPRQFSQFVACGIEADVMQHVSLLEKAETMGLVAVVESLLLNRPVFIIDKEYGVLHPYVYKLLLKYKQPVCSLAVEPGGVVKIIEYFTEHGDIEGAEDVISLLRDTNFF